MSDARDPYLGLNNHIRQQAREQAPTYYAIGKILSLRPLKIRADGLDLDRDDLRVPESMYSNFIQEKPVEGRGVRTRLPMKEFVCKCALSIGVATRPEEYVYGATILLTGSDGLPLYREVDWDFRTNKPVWKGGNPVYVTGGRAVLVWAWNALHTMRFNHDVFSTDYGLDGNTLLGQAYSGEVRESEAIRIVRETLQVNPYITNVTQVSVSFEGSVLHLSFKLTTIYGEVTIDDCDIAL